METTTMTIEQVDVQDPETLALEILEIERPVSDRPTRTRLANLSDQLSTLLEQNPNAEMSEIASEAVHDTLETDTDFITDPGFASGGPIRLNR